MINTTLSCDESDEHNDFGAESIVVPVLFGIIFVVGFLGNLVVILERDKNTTCILVIPYNALCSSTEVIFNNIIFITKMDHCPKSQKQSKSYFCFMSCNL